MELAYLQGDDPSDPGQLIDDAGDRYFGCRFFFAIEGADSFSCRK